MSEDFWHAINVFAGDIALTCMQKYEIMHQDKFHDYQDELNGCHVYKHYGVRDDAELIAMQEYRLPNIEDLEDTLPAMDRYGDYWEAIVEIIPQSCKK